MAAAVTHWGSAMDDPGLYDPAFLAMWLIVIAMGIALCLR